MTLGDAERIMLGNRIRIESKHSEEQNELLSPQPSTPNTISDIIYVNYYDCNFALEGLLRDQTRTLTTTGIGANCL